MCIQGSGELPRVLYVFPASCRSLSPCAPMQSSSWGSDVLLGLLCSSALQLLVLLLLLLLRLLLLLLPDFMCSLVAWECDDVEAIVMVGVVQRPEPWVVHVLVQQPAADRPTTGRL